jgi:regulator of ribosome biosynthesis
MLDLSLHVFPPVRSIFVIPIYTHQQMDVSTLLAKDASKYASTKVEERPVPLVVDLANLMCFDANAGLVEVPSSSAAPAHDDTTTMTTEDSIRATIRNATQHLINRIWELPITKSEDHTLLLAKLPTPGSNQASRSDNDISTTLPRAKPLPKPKPLTKWERFAKEKGIQNKKRGRMVWDEEEKKWVPRYGYQSVANRAVDDDWLIEVPTPNAKPSKGTKHQAQGDDVEDLFDKRRKEKKMRVDRNEKQRQRNVERAAAATEKSSGGRKSELTRAIKVARVSTASMGKFDQQVKGEEKIARKGQRKSYAPAVASDLSAERELARKVAQGVVGK